MTDDELRQLIESNSKAIAGNSESIRELRESQAQTNANLDRLTNITDRYIDSSIAVIQRLDQNIIELRAGQEQQARVLDYLLSKEQERQNGESR